MRIEPSSTINIYSGVEISAGHQIAFSSKTNQQAYFAKKSKFSAVNCLMIKKTGALRLNISGKLITDCNYISFVNPDFDNRTWYAIITDYEYVNNECVDIYYNIDYIQSYMFDVRIHDDCHIVREHLNQSKETLAKTDPYNSSLWELRTGENLPYGSECEKLTYNVENMVFSSNSETSSDLVTMVTVSNIDFEALDSATPDATPSSIYNEFIRNCKSSAFYSDPTGKANGIVSIIPNASATITNKFTAINDIFGFVDNMPAGYDVHTFLDYLTKWGCISSIVSIYRIPKYVIYTAYENYGQTANFEYTVATPSQPDPKLNLFPFSYIRMITPAGDVAEYHYELFATAKNSNCKFYKFTDISTTPSLNLVPVSYHVEFPLRPQLDRMDKSARLSFTQIPSAPYVTDTFLAEIASLSTQNVKNNTLSVREQRYNGAALDVVNAVTSATSGVATAASSLVSGNVGQSLATSATTATQIATLKNSFEQKMRDEALYFDSLSSLQGEGIPREYLTTRPAYAANNYQGPQGTGSIHYSDFDYLDIACIPVTLEDSIAEKYAKYFDIYGYASGRTGVPYIFNQFKGEASPDVLPAYRNKYTYIQVDSVNITNVPLQVSNFWEQMLRTGLRFLNGDE